MVGVADVLEWFKGSPEAEEMARRKEAERVESRAKIGAELGELTTEFEEALPGLVKDSAAAKTKADKAQAALDKARNEWATALAAERGARVSYDRHANRLRAELRESADPVIGEAITAFREEEDRLTRNGPESSITDRWADNATLTTNRPSWLARLDAVRSAIRRCEELKAEPLDGDELAKALAELRDGLPEIVDETSRIRTR